VSIPSPIGRVHSDEPRAVQIRDPEDLDMIHSTVFAGVHIYVDNVLQRQAILDNWSALMTALSSRVDQIIGSVPPA